MISSFACVAAEHQSELKKGEKEDEPTIIPVCRLSATGCASTDRRSSIKIEEREISAPQEFCVQKNAIGEWYWKLHGANYQVVAISEGYRRKADCEHAIKIVRLANDETSISYNCPPTT